MRIHPVRASAVVVAGLAAAALGLSACGSDSGSDNKDSASAGGGSAKKEVSAAMELTLTGVKFAQDTKTGAEQAAKQDGSVNLTINGPPSIDPVTAQKQVTDMLAKRPDAIGISPFPPEVWQRTLKTASDQVGEGKAIAVNVKPVGKADQASSAVLKTFVGVNDTELARTAARETIKAAKLGPDTTGTVLLGQCVAGNTGVLYERIQGFKDVVQQQLPKTTIKVFDSKVDPQGNTDTWTQTLKANPNPAMAIGTCDQDGTSLYKVKKSTSAKFPAGAVETPPETLRGIQDGSILATVAVNWYLEGYTAVRMLAEAARGQKPPEGFVDIGYTVVTKDNVAEIAKRDSSVANTVAWYAPKVTSFFGDVQANVKPLADAWK